MAFILKFKRIILLALIIIVFLGCHKSEFKFQTIIVDDLKAEGNIKVNKDTVYDGLIKFFDKRSDKLLYEEHYQNGMLNGETKHYYENGRVKISLNYRVEKENGYTTFYDSTGKIISQNYMYYGIRMGDGIEYLNGLVKSFIFLNLDGDILFQLNYDSIKSKRISDLQNGFFYYNIYQIDKQVSGNSKDYLFYIINPPKYLFTYSLVRIDEHYNVLNTIEVFPLKDKIHSFSIDSTRNSEGRLAIKLNIHDSINDLDNVMFKKL